MTRFFRERCPCDEHNGLGYYGKRIHLFIPYRPNPAEFEMLLHINGNWIRPTWKSLRTEFFYWRKKREFAKLDNEWQKAIYAIGMDPETVRARMEHQERDERKARMSGTEDDHPRG